MQSKMSSFMEALTGTFIGLLTSFIANAIILPAYNMHPTAWQNVQIVGWFTLLSVVRTYWVRRMWNAQWWKRVFGKVAV